MPASEDAFVNNLQEHTPKLKDAMTAQGASSLSSFSGVVLMACLFGRNLTHLHRSGTGQEDNDPQSPFWRRHRALDALLGGICLNLPDHLRLPSGLPDCNVIFLNMCIHTSTICLHQAAIHKSQRHRLSVDISNESRQRCGAAAMEITNIMRIIAHLDLTAVSVPLFTCSDHRLIRFS